VAIKVYNWSSLKPIHEFIYTDVKTESFSSKVVFNHSIPDLLKVSNCKDRTECVLLIEIENNDQKLAVINFNILKTNL
jgi:hypothetical protein